MRTHFHQQTHEVLDEQFNRTLHVQSFSPNDIYIFLTKWPFYNGDRQAEINQIYAELASRPNLREMCRNPLVLAMYIANYQRVISADLPDTRTQFYTKVARELLIMRRSRQLGSRKARLTLERQRLQVLGAIAFDNLVDPSCPANSIQLNEVLKIVQKVTKCSNEDKAEEIFNELANETGLMSEDAPGETVSSFTSRSVSILLRLKLHVKGLMDGRAYLMRTRASPPVPARRLDRA
jgi:hypothetical protein